MAEPSQIFAFLDESAISDEKGPGTYLLCAVVCNRSQLDELRQVCRTFSLGALASSTGTASRGNPREERTGSQRSTLCRS